ncbi:hypothetical protein D1AOALGA4SA_6352 [Olavius algarvensis Delta 1 endosymbiont]|nr:hypothetical protein D1AOALGA4SA_6352 [Olavius algarvensis Delta 1 endosymbiont]
MVALPQNDSKLRISGTINRTQQKLLIVGWAAPTETAYNSRHFEYLLFTRFGSAGIVYEFMQQ